ncbi:MAG: MFS transporter [Thermomicrobiales bacterium]|nr:MFS transporter [Thermomicrobiales bacterium]MCO5224414.1 MFS transporter [Thermomicrobiales bacterium]
MFHPYSWLSRAGSLSTPKLIALISFFGQLYFFVPVMTPYLQGKGLSLAQIAGMQTMLMVSMLVMEVPTGVLADRLGHRRSYQISLFMAAMGEIVTLLANNYSEFMFGQFVAGTGFAFASGSVDALLYESLPKADRTVGMQRAKGMLGAAIQAASLVAYSIGGWLTRELTYENMRFTLKLDVVFVGFAAVLALLLREPVREIVAERMRSLDLLKFGWGNLRNSPPLQRLIVLSIATNAFVPHLLIFYQEYFLTSSVAPVWLGMGLALGSGVAFFTQLHAWRLSTWLGDRGALLVATGVPGVLYLAMAAFTHPTVAVILFVAQWGMVQVAQPLFSGLYNEHIEEGARATTLSLISGVVTIYISVGGVILGWLAGINLSMMFVILGAIIIAGAVLVRPLPEPAQ